MKQQLLLFFFFLSVATTLTSTHEFSSRALRHAAHKSYQQHTRMSDQQHRKEKKFARQRLIEERQAQRQHAHDVRRGKIQAHSNKINAQRTHAQHHEKVLDMKRLKHRTRLLLNQTERQKQAYINYETTQQEYRITTHNAAREALRDLPR